MQLLSSSPRRAAVVPQWLQLLLVALLLLLLILPFRTIVVVARVVPVDELPDLMRTSFLDIVGMATNTKGMATTVHQLLVKHKPDGRQTTTTGIMPPLGGDMAYDNGTTALSLACMIGDTELVRVLLDFGAKVDFQLPNAEENGTPLMYASVFGNVDTARLLIERGAAVNQGRKLERHQKKKLTISSLMGDSDLDSSKILEQQQHQFEGATPLIIAAANGDVDLARMLLANGADANKKDQQATSPLLYAIMTASAATSKPVAEQAASVQLISYNHLRMVELLVENGAEVTKCTRAGSASGQQLLCPLRLAAETGVVEMARLLIDKGAKIDSRDETGDTPLINAVQHGHIEMAKYLLEKGADVNAVSTSQGATVAETALFAAVSDNNAPLVQILLEVPDPPPGLVNWYTYIMRHHLLPWHIRLHIM